MFSLLILYYLNPASMLKSPELNLFKEDLVLKENERDENFLWSDRSLVSGDHKGNIYIADRDMNHILAYDKHGSFLRRVARQGPGPGEITKLAYFRVLEDGRLVVYDLAGGVNANFKFYNPDGILLETIKGKGLSLILSQVEMNRNGNLMVATGTSLNTSTGSQQRKSLLLDNRLNVVSEFSDRKEGSVTMVRSSDPLGNDFWADTLSKKLNSKFSGGSLFTIDDEGRPYSAKTSKYEITRWDKSGAIKETVFSRLVKPDPSNLMQQKEQMVAYCEKILRQIPSALRQSLNEKIIIEKAIEKADLSTTGPVLVGLRPMPDGRLLVVRNVDSATHICKADLFSKKGSYLGKITMPDYALFSIDETRISFNGNYAFSLLTNVEGEYSVIRYRIQ